MQELHVLRVRIESEDGLHLSGAHAEPVLELIVDGRPVQNRMPLSERPDIANVYLRTYAQLVGNRHGHVQSAVGKDEAALAGLHGQVILVIRVREALRCKTMDLNRSSLYRE